MNPRRKLSWFSSKDWAASDIRSAKQLVSQEYANYVAKYHQSQSSVPPPVVSRPKTPPGRRNPIDAVIFDSPEKPSGQQDELKIYFEAARVYESISPIRWWYDRRAQYPILSQMALDYLSTPGM